MSCPMPCRGSRIGDGIKIHESMCGLMCHSCSMIGFDITPALLVITSTAFATSALTAMIGAGGGSALRVVMLYLMPATSVVPVHGCIQLVSNTARVWLFWRHMNWRIIASFVAPMPLGVYLGLQVYDRLDPAGIQLVIAAFVLVSLFIRAPKRVSGTGLPSWVYGLAGVVIGAGNMIVGVLAPVLGAMIRLEQLGKEATVGTLGFFGFAGNVLKIAGFVLTGFAFAPYAPTIICASLATIAGNIVGKKLLAGMTSKVFEQAFRLMLTLLAAKLVWDALRGM